MSALLAALLAAAPIPPLTGPVVDLAGLLDPADRTRIGAALARYKESSGNQMQVLIVPSLEGDSIDEYSIRVAEAWRLGSAEKDNGVLLTLAVEDRAWRIEVGGGLEGELTDAHAARIGRNTLVPAFKAGRYAEGISATLESIAAALGNELDLGSGAPTSHVVYNQEKPFRLSLGTIIFILFLLMMMFGGRRRRGFFTGMLLGHMLGGGFRGGRRSGGFGGGWGGGGGGFSGGGASGRW